MRITINIPDEGASELSDLLQDLSKNGRVERLRLLATLGVPVFKGLYGGGGEPFMISRGSNQAMSVTSAGGNSDNIPSATPSESDPNASPPATNRPSSLKKMGGLKFSM